MTDATIAPMRTIAVLGMAALVACTTTPPPVPTAISSPSPEASVHGGMQGETPPADAPLPPRPAGLPGLELGDVVAVAGDLGTECRSGESSLEYGSPWAVSCTGIIGDVDLTITVTYWSLSHIDSVHATALPSPIEGVIADPSDVLGLFQPLAQLPYDGANPDAAAEWLAGAFGGPGCHDVPCVEPIGPSDLMYQAGVRGAASFSVGLRQ